MVAIFCDVLEKSIGAVEHREQLHEFRKSAGLGGATTSR
jgi:hypothetical protein